MAKPFNIFHIKIDRISFNELLLKTKKILEGEKLNTIVTPNPEIALKAEKDHEYRDALNAADIRLPDGFGLVLASKILGTPLEERVTGVDYLSKLLRYASKHQYTVHVLLHEEGLTRSTALRSYLEKNYRELRFTCQESSTQYLLSGYIIDDINKIRPDILIVTFGAPFQERWLHNNRNRLKGVHLAFAVGGAFDMLTGKIKRAPKLMRRLMLEWLWRIIVQPENRIRRMQRIFDAVVVFSVKVMILKFRTIFIYRKNGLAFVYKNKDKILVLHKRGYRDAKRVRSGHWAFPQGGVEKNEPLKHATIRELKEETGITSLGKITPSYEKNKYKWSSYYRNIYSHRFAGQRQKAFFIEFTGDEEEVRLNFIGNENFDAYEWVSQNELLKRLEYSRQPYAKRLLLEFNKRMVYKKEE